MMLDEDVGREEYYRETNPEDGIREYEEPIDAEGNVTED